MTNKIIIAFDSFSFIYDDAFRLTNLNFRSVAKRKKFHWKFKSGTDFSSHGNIDVESLMSRELIVLWRLMKQVA